MRVDAAVAAGGRCIREKPLSRETRARCCAVPAQCGVPVRTRGFERPWQFHSDTYSTTALRYNGTGVNRGQDCASSFEPPAPQHHKTEIWRVTARTGAKAHAPSAWDNIWTTRITLHAIVTPEIAFVAVAGFRLPRPGVLDL